MSASKPPRQDLPASWAAYDRGGRTDSTDSAMSHGSVQFDPEQGQRHRDPSDASHLNPYSREDQNGQELRRRRSSMGMRLNALRQVGGANSFDNFARSWQRAAGFYEVTPVRQSFRFASDDEGDSEERESHGALHEAHHRSMLRQQLSTENRTLSDHALEDEETTPPAGLSRTSSGPHERPSGEREPLLSKTTSHGQQHPDDSIFLIEPSLASPFGGSYGGTWGSLSSRVNENSMLHAGRLFKQQQMKGSSGPDKEREPLIVKKMQEEDGKIVNVVIGQSTLPQTIFNSVNVLVGVGLLALPLAFQYSGWVWGMLFLTFSGIATCYTAKLLAKCADVDTSLITFADLAYVSFGKSARVVVSILFMLELLGACVALVILFADSLDALIPGWGLIEWKILCGIILVPLSFVPLSMLSFTSILGILCCFGIVLAVIVDGIIKPHQPGSLREPATTTLFPANWATLPISFGILMSPWGGHSVFPNIYRDMRHPFKYRKAVNVTYVFTFTIDVLMAVVGWLMFGAGVKDEVTRNILLIDRGYPAWIGIFVVICVAIIPITKIPLNARPIVSTLEVALGLDARALGNTPATHGMTGLTRGILKIAVRIVCVAVFVLLAVLIPEFDRIMSLLGSVACFSICLILPCAFHLKLFGEEMPRWQKVVDWSLLVVSTALALVSTAFNFIPKSKLGF